MSARSAAVIGGTGHVGSQILAQLLASPETAKVAILQRREAKTPHEKLVASYSTETDKWPALFTETIKDVKPPVTALFSGLATTRGLAGGFDKMYLIDYTLNYDIAKAAKEAGVETYAIISSTGATNGSIFPYVHMKGKLEDDVKALGFKRTIIVRPGMLVGEREVSRPFNGESILQCIFKGVKAVFGYRGTDFWAQEPDIVARATIKAAYAEGGDFKGDANGVWVLGQSDIIRLGREEKKTN